MENPVSVKNVRVYTEGEKSPYGRLRYLNMKTGADIEWNGKAYGAELVNSRSVASKIMVQTWESYHLYEKRGDAELEDGAVPEVVREALCVARNEAIENTAEGKYAYLAYAAGGEKVRDRVNIEEVVWEGEELSVLATLDTGESLTEQPLQVVASIQVQDAAVLSVSLEGFPAIDALTPPIPRETKEVLNQVLENIGEEIIDVLPEYLASSIELEAVQKAAEGREGYEALVLVEGADLKCTFDNEGTLQTIVELDPATGLPTGEPVTRETLLQENMMWLCDPVVWNLEQEAVEQIESLERETAIEEAIGLHDNPRETPSRDDFER